MLTQSKDWLIVFALITLMIFSVSAFGQESLNEKVLTIRKEIEEIRGKKFKKDVRVENQDIDGFGEYLDRNIDLQFPENLSAKFDKIVRTLGLYRGKEISDFKSMAKMVMQSQAAAYYDPNKSTFYVVMQDLPEQMLDAVFAHELYHGFQDQHFNLNNYFLRQIEENKLNDDELMARQAVVEGEATYLMTLWTTKKMLGALPDLSLLKVGMDIQANMSSKQLFEMIKQTVATNPNLGDIKVSAKAIDDIPGFVLDSMVGAYMKGMRFIYELHTAHGWAKIAELYNEPPASTEQILHPEKWSAKERPYIYDWPDFDSIDAFQNWNLLEQNTLGELQWRSVFAEYEVANNKNSATAGWDGDSYTVFESMDEANTLLLIVTNWDTEQDATEFTTTYRTIQDKKFEVNKGAQKLIEQNGKAVYIVESSKQIKTKAFLKILTNLGRRK